MSSPQQPGLLPTDAEVPAHRVIGLSDGVFAIATTLLVLDLKLPELAGGLSGSAAEGRFDQALLDLLPKLLIYGGTFMLVGLSWLTHAGFMALLRRYDRRLALLNVAYLLFVSLVPFSTALMGSNGGFRWAIAVYALNQACISGMFLLMWRHATQRSAFVSPELARHLPDRASVNLGVFLSMAGVALLGLSIGWLQVAWLLPVGLPFIYAVRRRRSTSG